MPSAGRAGAPANEQERVQVGKLAKQVQVATQRSVRLARVDQGYTGKKQPTWPTNTALRWKSSNLAEAKRGLVLLPRR